MVCFLVSYHVVKLIHFVFLIELFYSDLPPSQGGKYSGFGYSRDAPPRSQSQEFVDTAMSSLASVSNKCRYM